MRTLYVMSRIPFAKCCNTAKLHGIIFRATLHGFHLTHVKFSQSNRFIHFRRLLCVYRRKLISRQELSDRKINISTLPFVCALLRWEVITLQYISRFTIIAHELVNRCYVTITLDRRGITITLCIHASMCYN